MPMENEESFDVTAMIYGNSGVGKTRFLATATDDPRTSPTVWIDLEGGTKSIRSKVRVLNGIAELGDPVPGLIDVIRVKTWTDVQNVYNWLFQARYEKKRVVYKALVIDSLTEINNLALDFSWKGGGVGENTMLTSDVPQQRDYLKTNTLMKKMLRALRDMEDIHIFMSALPQNKAENPKDENSPVWTKPNLVGKLADEAVAIVDYAGYLRAKLDGSREMIFQPEGRIIAKERSEDTSHIKTIKAPNRDSFITISAFMDAALNEKKK